MENINGKDVSVTVFVDGNPEKEFKAKNFQIKRNATEISDPVLGADRDDLDDLTNSFSLSFSIYVATNKFLKTLLKEQAGQDSNAARTDKAVSFRVKTRDGGKFGLILSGDLSIGSWDLGAGGRAERGMMNVPMRCKYMEEVSL